MQDNNEIDKYIELSVMFDTFKYIPRLGTKRIPIAEKESVAIHLYEMNYLAYLAYYSMDEVYQNQLDLLKILKLIMWHEADETITNDIPYPAKRALRENGFGNVLLNIKDTVRKIFKSIIPESLQKSDEEVLGTTFGHYKSEEKSFVKFLDYVNLYLNSIKLCDKGYNLEKTIEECRSLTVNHSWYLKCPLVMELIKHPHKFTDKEYN